MVCTSRCWAPSCRSRSIRRRVSSAVSTILRREAVSSALLWAFATAVATSSVNCAIRACVSGRTASGCVKVAAITPHVRPETTIGAVTAAPAPVSSRRSLRSTGSRAPTSSARSAAP